MSKRGRKPKPDALKKREGTFRRDRAHAGLALPPGVPECPAGLPDDAAAIWAELTSNEAWRVVLTKADSIGLELLVKHMALERRFAKLAAKQPIVKTPFGPKTHPAVSEARKEAAIVKGLLGEFGLTPAERERVGKGGSGGAPAAPADGTPLRGPGLRVVTGGTGA